MMIKVKDNIPATIMRNRGGEFLSCDEMYVGDVGKKIANTILQRIYKGIEGANSNCVIVELKQELNG
jgi:hypothetical protein